MRVTAQLIDAGPGTHVWSERWDRPTQDVFAVQAELAEAVAAKLGGYATRARSSRPTGTRRGASARRT